MSKQREEWDGVNEGDDDKGAMSGWIWRNVFGEVTMVMEFGWGAEGHGLDGAVGGRAWRRRGWRMRLRELRRKRHITCACHFEPQTFNSQVDVFLLAARYLPDRL
jgi:hypothetical protein